MAQIVLATAVLLFIRQWLSSNIIAYSGVRKISCRTEGFFELFEHFGEGSRYKLQSSSTIIGRFFFLHFVSVSGLRPTSLNVVLASDSLTADEARNLTVALNVYKTDVVLTKA